MADPIVSTERTYALKDTDRVHELLYQAKAIAATIRSASTSNDTLPDDAIPGACWALENLLDEAWKALTTDHG